ncbi:putative G-protein coupled receptor 179 [Lonchura striata]
MLFQTNDIREASVAEDVEWYQALVRSLAEGHPWVRRAVLALDAHPLAPKPRLMLQATKGDGQILLQDVSNAAPDLGNLSWDSEWFNGLKSQRLPALRKRLLSNDLRSLETPKWQRGDSYLGDPGHVRWSPPFLECREGRFVPTWAVTLSSAFYGLKPDLSPEFKGVVRVDVELRDVAIDQCSSGPGWFSDTHRCDLNSTQCVPQESRGFVLGRYLCRCKPGFYRAGGAASGAWAGVAGADGGSRLGCRPCPPGCATCEDDSPCLVQEDRVLRAAVLSCQACCMLAVFLSMLLSYHFRRSKRIRTSGIVLLETILFGSLLLYFPVFILYFQPSVFRCIVLRWVRMLGFAIVYGTITLKLYRVLRAFLARAARRAPSAPSGRALRLLAPILLPVLWFLAAWTAGALQDARRNVPLVTRAQTARGLRFSLCRHDCWDYMMVIAEVLFLLWGSFLCHATRAVPSAFHEPRYLGIALHNELVLSAAFHALRFLIVPSLHPDWTLLLFFAHTHGTTTMTLALLFIPKFLHTGSPLREEITAEVYEDELDMRRSGSCMNSSIASAWSERSLDPDDIREELKKLYRQLEVHKTWRMATNNPHLAKKRSSRRSLARSILRRSDAGLAESCAGDRPGTLSRRSSSAKRLADASGTGLRMRDESSRRRSSALRKSRSSEGPPREPRRGSPTRSPPEEPPPAAVRDVEQSDSDSLDAAPLLCKSASAQNLAGHWQRPPGRPPPLQKSHSVVTGAREVALLAARHLSAPAPGVPSDTATPQSPRGSQEDAAPPGDAEGHERVTYVPVKKSVSVDSARPARKVRVTVKKTPPPPPVRYQSLQRSGTLGDSPEPAPGPPGPAGQAEGTAGHDPERGSPPAGKGRMLTPRSAHVCPWELVQDEILSRKQKAAEAAESGSPGDTAATSPGPKPPPAKSFRSLGLAIKALNRSRGKSILKGKSEGSLRKRGSSSRREKPGLAEASAVSLGGLSPNPAAKTPEGSGQSPETPALQHNNNAATPGEAAGWGDSGTGGQGARLAAGTGDGDTAAEEPSAARGKAGTGGRLEPPSSGHQGAERPPEVARAQERDEAPDLGEGIPGVTAEEGTLDELEGTSGSFQPRDQPEEEQPPAKLAPSSVRGAAGPKPRAGLGPPGSLGAPAGRGALLRQQAIAPREEAESPDKALGEPSSRPDSERVPGRSRSGAGRAQPPGTRGDSSPEAGICPGMGGSEADSQRAPGMEKPPELPKLAPEEAEGRRVEVCPWESREQGGSVRAEICPWDTEGALPEQGSPKSGGVEQPGMGKPPALPRASSQRAEEIKKASICPWEVEGEPRPKTEICPWEEAAAPSGKERSREDTRGTSKGEEKVGARAPEKGKQHPAKSLPKSPPGRSQSSEKAEICPWESQDLKSSDKAEICPWEAAAPQLEKGTAPGKEKLPGKDITKALENGSRERESICPWESQGSKSSDKAEICPWEVAEPQLEKGTAPGKEKLPGKDTTKALEKGSRERESICPWENQDRELTPAKSQTGSSALPKAPSGTSQSSEKAEICPWEVESSSKAEICPWEVAEPPCQQPKAKQVPAGGTKGDKRITRQAALGSPERSLGSRDRASVCPWESQDRELTPAKSQTGSSALPKGAPGTSQSSEKAEICPWELESSSKAEICPWESPDTEQPLVKSQTGSSALPKAPSGRPQSSEKAEICPWDTQDVECSSKAEICPWEVAEPELEKGTAPGKEKLLGKAEKGSRERESVCPWESPDTELTLAKSQTGSSALTKGAPGKSQSSEKAEICPWESQGSKSSDKAEICPWEVAAPQLEKGTAPGKEKLPSRELSEILEKGSRDRVSVCPWESPDTEQPLVKPQTGSSALPKAPSGTSQSSDKEKICPWELESSDKAEICPWEVAEPELEKGTAPGKEKILGKDTTKALEKGSRERESICPWESQGSKSSDKAEICPWEVAEPELEKGTAPGNEKILGKDTTKALEKGSSERESICPWESQGSKSSDKAEICPWEVAEPQLEKGTAPGKEKLPPEASKAEEKGSRDRESICPWESLDREELSPKSAVGKEPSHKSHSTESRKSAICPWEAAAPVGLEEEMSQPDVQAQAAQKASSAGMGQPGASAGSPTPLEKSRGGSHEHKPLCRLLPGAQRPGVGSSPGPGAGLAEVCPWEAGEAPAGLAKPSLDMRNSSEVCPWEEESTDPSRTCPGHGRARDGGGV